MTRFKTTALIFILAVLLVGVFSGIALAQAQDCTAEFCPLSPAPAGSRLSDLYGSTSLSDFINNLFRTAIAVGAILAVLRISYAGYRYMTSDAFGTKSDARKVITDVVIGLLLLLSIWLILRQINPQILDLDALKHIPKLESRATPERVRQEMSEQQQNNPTQPPTDFKETTSPTPLAGYNCFKSSAGQEVYKCLTSQANCEQLAKSEGVTGCTYHSNSETIASQPMSGYWCYFNSSSKYLCAIEQAKCNSFANAESSQCTRY